MTLEQQIEQLKKDLTGNLMQDIDTQGKIYELKKQIAKQQGITFCNLEHTDKLC